VTIRLAGLQRTELAARVIFPDYYNQHWIIERSTNGRWCKLAVAFLLNYRLPRDSMSQRAGTAAEVLIGQY
jgi:hypothetical protein